MPPSRLEMARIAIVQGAIQGLKDVAESRKILLFQRILKQNPIQMSQDDVRQLLKGLAKRAKGPAFRRQS